MSTDQRFHRIDTNVRNDRIAQLVAHWNGDTKAVERYGASYNRLLELRLAVEAGRVSMSSD